MKKKNKFMESLGIGKDKKVTILFYLLVIYAVIINICYPLLGSATDISTILLCNRVIDISNIVAIVCTIYLVVRMYKNSKNKSKEDDDEVKKW